MVKKKFFEFVLTLAIALIVSAACFTPVLAQVSYLEHVSAAGATIVDLAANQPAFKIFVAHFDGGDHGVGDYLEMDTLQIIPGVGTVWATVAIMTDSPSIAALNKDFVYAGLPGPPKNIMLVKHCELEVCRIGKIVFAHWTAPLVTSAVTLPPGWLLFGGYGSIQNKQLVFHFPNGVTLTVDSVGYAANAAFACPTWKYIGSVGDQSTAINIAASWLISHA
jgi:hypothetical protein